jgi:hypothetical protein
MIAAATSTTVRLPPPLRGRVGEGGMPRAPAEEIRQPSASQTGEAINDVESAVLPARQAAEQAAPHSLTSRASFARLGPRKGGGSGEGGVLDDAEGER